MLELSYNVEVETKMGIRVVIGVLYIYMGKSNLKMVYMLIVA